MKKKLMTLILAASMSMLVFAGCGGQGGASSAAQSSETEAVSETAAQTEAVSETAQTSAAPAQGQSLADGVYSAVFTTDGSMFHVNEACQDLGLLTVENGVMTLHVSLTSKNIVNLFPGTAADAQKDGAQLLEPVLDTVYYSDGTSEEVNGFDVPVPAIGEEFDLALIGSKGKWYDHKVTVTDPVENGTVPGYEPAGESQQSESENE